MASFSSGNFGNSGDLEALKAANPLPEVLLELGVAVENNRFRCLNPQNHKHGDRTASVTIWPERGFFKCWVCPDFKGDVIDLLKQIKGITFREAVRYLENRSPGGAPIHRQRTPPSRTPVASKPPPPPTRATDSPSPPRANARQTGLFEEGFAPGKPSASPPPVTGVSETRKLEILGRFLELLEPVDGKAAAYLKKRRIFKKTWDAQKILQIKNYSETDRRLSALFPIPELEDAGFFSKQGHLRFYRHTLIFPYYDFSGRPLYLQARAIEDLVPKELSLKGPIPLPYNVRILDGSSGHIYLCEGVIDALTLLEQGFPAAAVPGAQNFKPQWAPLFKGKTVHVVFDSDEPGEKGAARVLTVLGEAGVEARRLAPPPGMDINEWFLKGAARR